VKYKYLVPSWKLSCDEPIVFCTLSFIIGVKCDLKAIINKIRKLHQKYKEEKTKTSKSGRARGQKWKFFDKMDCILGHRANISPPWVLDSSVDQTEEGEGDMLVSENREVDNGNSNCSCY